MSLDASCGCARPADEPAPPRRVGRLRPRDLAVALIRVYRQVLSPWLPAACRFEPSCSRYAIEAYTRHGIFGGSWRTLRRLSRCHPWHPGGYDPVD